MLTTDRSSAIRLLLVDLSELERNSLGDSLVAAGFDVTFAVGHTDLCLKLLTWRPDFVLADADLGSGDPARLVEVIRTTVRTPVDIVLLSQQSIAPELDATVLPTPADFSRLLAVLQTALAGRMSATD